MCIVRDLKVLKKKVKVEDKNDNSESETQEDLEEAEDEESFLEDVESVVKDLKEELLKAEATSKEFQDKYLRKAAEFENFKKRSILERSDLLKYAGEHLAYDLLEVVDELQMAVGTSNKGDLEDFSKGIEMVLNRFLEVLKSHQIEGSSSLGEKFDPSKHEALTTVETDEKEPGIVMQELKKLYFFKDKLIRPAQVVVSMASKKEDVEAKSEKEEENLD